MRNNLSMYATRRSHWTDGIPYFIATVLLILSLFAAWKVGQAQEETLNEAASITQDQIDQQFFCAHYGLDCYQTNN